MIFELQKQFSIVDNNTLYRLDLIGPKGTLCFVMDDEMSQENLAKGLRDLADRLERDAKESDKASA